VIWPWVGLAALCCALPLRHHQLGICAPLLDYGYGLNDGFIYCFGAITLGPWLNKSAEIAAAAKGAIASVNFVSASDRLYLHLSQLLSVGVPIRLLLLLVVVVSSYVQPWSVTPWRRR